ncbi:PTS sugar transporter subunit IIC [Actinomyces qiguomingii]|uniref:PTS sugar transporter subunit IIC n=1 Tax=Actinomyces qiguomingii TaxID=2057800 RepID=UPI000CA0069E|nr:PTS transporter subunit EIIC [Actinomyces qiguomingii]
MDALIGWLETSFSPRMAKVNNNVWSVSIKDAIMQVLPFILVGSVFAMLAILNDYFPTLPSFWVPYGWTMGMLSLLVSFLIPLNLMEKRGYRKQRLIAGGCGTILFLIIITPQVVQDGEAGFGHSALGAGGMFIAILAGVVTGAIMSLFGRFSLFKEDSVIPEFVRAWFDAMIPVALVVTLGWVSVDLLGLDVHNAVLAVFRPLAGVIESPWGFPLMCFIYCFLYSMGISTWVLTPVTTPVLLVAIQENMSGTAQNLVTSTMLFSTYLWFGGIGNTMALVIMMARSKSSRLKALGRACIPPMIANINEPVVFGAIAWNPVLMIPMWLQGVIPPIIIWLLTKTIHFAPIPMNQYELWYTPYPLATWITTRSLAAMILMLVVFAVSAVIWYPFFKVYERQSLLKEVDTARESGGGTKAEETTVSGAVAANTARPGVRRGSRRLVVTSGGPRSEGE